MNNYTIAGLVLGCCLSIYLVFGASVATDLKPGTDENDTGCKDQQQQQTNHHDNKRDDRKQTSPQHMNDEYQKKKATAELLRLLSTEIARDGGASVVTSLKDYLSMNGKRFNSLLYHSIGHAKLLRFFEHHSDVFRVDRNNTPHIVQLLSRQHVDSKLLMISKDQTKLEEMVRSKASYVLQKRQAKLNRRRRKKQQTTNTTTTDKNEKKNYAVNDTITANLSWVLEQSVGDFHLYLRASGFYIRELLEKNHCNKLELRREAEIKVPLVGSRAWQDLVLEEFGKILNADPESRFTMSDSQSNSRKVWLSHLDPNATTDQVENGLLDEPEPLDKDYVEKLEECLVRLVHQDGGHEVRLELLLHRHVELKQALGGRDFSTIYNETKIQLEQAGISCRQQGVDWIFCSTVTEDSKYGGGGRMMVDQVGLYSVTNSKWGTAIGNIMVHCCKNTLGTKLNLNGVANHYGEDESRDLRSNLTLVDMTASVGGMTLGLAKTEYFDQILAYEVDSERAKLCQANMKRHGMEDIVQVRNQDSVQALSSFSPSKEDQYCFVIDPPWGGVAYKQKTKRYSQFFMGPWSLKDVLIRMYTYCKPCLVGMRLPEDRTKVNDLLEELRQENLRFEIKTLRKLSVQRFVVLYFLPE